MVSTVRSIIPLNKLIFILIIINLGCKQSESIIEKKASSNSYSNNLYPIKYNEQWGYADFFGNTIIEPQFDEASLFYYDIAVVKQNNLYGYISLNGHWLIKAKYISAGPFELRYYGPYEDGKAQKKLIAKVSEGKGDFYINTSDSPIKQINFSRPIAGCVEFLSRLDEYSIKNGDGTYEITFQYLKTQSDTSGYVIHDTTNLRLDTIIEIDRHYALLKKNHKYAIYQTAFSQGIDLVANKRIVIPRDSSYKVSPKFIYQGVKFVEANDKKRSSNIYRKNSKWGILSTCGQEIVPFIYYDIIPQERSHSYLVEFEQGQYGCISIIYESTAVNRGREKPQSKFVIQEHFKREKAAK